LKYPSAIASFIVLAIMLAISVYAMVTIPYGEAVRLWRGGEDIWYRNPKTVPPEWTNLFRSRDLPASFALDSRQAVDDALTTEAGSLARVRASLPPGEAITLVYTFDYPYAAFPQDLVLFFAPEYEETPPFVTLTWLTPDGRQIRLDRFSVQVGQAYYLSQDADVQRRMGGLFPQVGLFAVPASQPAETLAGRYSLVIEAVTFEEGADLEVEFVLYGLVSGWAGTDHLRRDLGVALLWGTPIALAFGLLAALGTTITTMTIAAFGVWFGGWVDELIQRITEVNLVLPFLPILIMIGTFYSRSIWLMLGATIALSIFGGAIKSYRAIFLQVKESPYIEAARAYGASSMRIILLYLVPRIIPLLIPTLVTLIPTYVFLEASLAVLGLGDPVLPTWGKIINDAQSNGALYQGLYYWVLEPAVLLMITGLAFALLGFAMDRIFNPRLRGV